ncbi:unnamed protein product [Strongylus vulgaris]|uniref:Histidine acid phosphatase n=1 Tax=Strongylus vulgaris TaxID=40348 RepID=A0A3P7LPH5_STRVU|nr:unnamed protein product [Strongylus vulgaris]
MEPEIIIFGVFALIEVIFVSDNRPKKVESINFPIFRHGDRAPTDRLSNQSFINYFPYGLGRLTRKGIENSYHLGTFLRKRYVETGFLHLPLHVDQVYFRSKANDRCLMSASLVANAMFNVDKEIVPMAPIYTQESNDWLLSSNVNCAAELKRDVAKCGWTPKADYDDFTEFEGLIFECLGLHKNNKLFPDGKSFKIADSLINEVSHNVSI